MDWITTLRNAEKTAIIEKGKRKVHYKFQDGQEMAEEYNTETNVLTRRAWKRGNNLSRKNEWDIEVGEHEYDESALDTIGIKENIGSPYCIKRITKTTLEWRIRNLSYPVEVFSVTADPESRCIIVRTSNKKYYKKIPIPELDRANLLPEQNNISFALKFGTLIISYKKPAEVLEMEKEVLDILKDVQTIEDGELPCRPS